jgi:hypothetical protein
MSNEKTLLRSAATFDAALPACMCRFSDPGVVDTNESAGSPMESKPPPAGLCVTPVASPARLFELAGFGLGTLKSPPPPVLLWERLFRRVINPGATTLAVIPPFVVLPKTVLLNRRSAPVVRALTFRKPRAPVPDLEPLHGDEVVEDQDRRIRGSTSVQDHPGARDPVVAVARVGGERDRMEGVGG